MKKTIVYLFLLGIIFVSCDKNDLEERSPETCEDTMTCEDDCLFTVFNRDGRVSFFRCYNSWGIFYKEDPTNEFDEVALVLDMPEEYQVEDKEVNFSATFFINDIQIAVGDPPFWERSHVVELCEIRAQD